MTGPSGRPPPPPPQGPPGWMPPPPAMPPPGADHRPVLDLGAAFRFGWETFRTQPGPLIVAVVVSYGLMFALGVVAVGLVMWLTAVEPVPVPLVIVLVVLGMVVFTLTAQLQAIWMLRAGSDAVDGRRITFGRMVDPAGLGTAIAAAGLVMGGVLVGYLLLVLPGIVFGVMAAFTLHHVIDGGLGPTDAIRASIALVRRHPGSALGLFLVTTFVGSVGVYACGIGVVVSAPVALLAQVHGFRQLSDGQAPAA